MYASVSVRVWIAKSDLFSWSGEREEEDAVAAAAVAAWEGAMALIFVRISHGLLLTECLRTAKNVTHSDARVF